ncbi:MAG: ribonuclease HII [Thermodesulfobacteriota bacterium]|nr:ribonuclease HII [Thermodesulfobacteriota bacterium]
MRSYEDKAISEGFFTVAGIDEAGRGPLAGPVVASAVVFPDGYTNPLITDSKKITPKKRATLYEEIYRDAVTVGIGIIDAVEIDRINILQAALLAMAIAVDNLFPHPDYLLIDGKFTIASPIPQAAIVRGDSASISIAGASIVAKVTRDIIMERYHLDYPEFGFSAHKGYPTKAHREVILQHGPTPIHRMSFRGSHVRQQ